MPFAPLGDPDLAAKFMFSGISQAGKGLAGGLANYLEEREKRKEKEAGKKRDRSAYSTILKGMHDRGEVDEETFHQLGNADTDTLAGTVIGLQAGQAMQSQSTKIQIQGEDLKGYTSRRRFNEAYSEGPATGAGKVPSVQERITHAVGQAPGGISPEDLLRYSGSATGPDGEFVTDPRSGNRFFRSRNTTLPSGVDQEVAERNRGSGGAHPEEEMLSTGKGSGWARFPDGKYRRLPNTKDTLNASKYDTDGDGILSHQEWVGALMGEKSGGIAPGMRVSPGGGGGATNAPAAAQPGLYDGFKEFMKKRYGK